MGVQKEAGYKTRRLALRWAWLRGHRRLLSSSRTPRAAFAMDPIDVAECTPLLEDAWRGDWIAALCRRGGLDAMATPVVGPPYVWALPP